MFRLDDQFLDDAGLAELPEVDRKGLLEHLYDILQVRVGSQLSKGLSDAQLAEFEQIIDHDVDAIVAWVQRHAPDFLEDPVYLHIRDTLSGAPGSAILCEYAATKWLHVNREDFRDIVAAEVHQLTVELAEAAPGILASFARPKHMQSRSTTG